LNPLTHAALLRRCMRCVQSLAKRQRERVNILQPAPFTIQNPAVKRRINAGVRGEAMNAKTRRSNPRHCCSGARFAYAMLWNRLATPGNSIQTVRNSGDRRGGFWR